MTDENEQPKPSPRGQAAWKASMDQVAERNDKARKAGMAARDAKDKRAAAARTEAERREARSMADSAARSLLSGGAAKSYGQRDRGTGRGL